MCGPAGRTVCGSLLCVVLEVEHALVVRLGEREYHLVPPGVHGERHAVVQRVQAQEFRVLDVLEPVRRVDPVVRAGEVDRYACRVQDGPASGSHMVLVHDDLVDPSLDLVGQRREVRYLLSEQVSVPAEVYEREHLALVRREPGSLRLRGLYRPSVPAVVYVPTIEELVRERVYVLDKLRDPVTELYERQGSVAEVL